jgi:transposase
MIPCKNCHQNNTVKNGYVRNKQRYKCHSCGYNFVEGDARHKRETEMKAPRSKLRGIKRKWTLNSQR